MDRPISFPQFRRLANGRSYYKIHDTQHMEEVQVMGRFWMVHTLHAKILPERVLIADILSLTDRRWEEITEHQYIDFVENCRKEKFLQTV
jgi:hypothetical protein